MIIGITTTLNEADGYQRVNVEYISRVAQAGAIPVLIPPIEGGFEKNAEQARGVIGSLDGIILSGGGDIHPRHYVKAEDESVWNLDEAQPHPSSAGGAFCAEQFTLLREREGSSTQSAASSPEATDSTANASAAVSRGSAYSSGAVLAGGQDAQSGARTGAPDTIQLDGRTTEESDAVVPFCLDGLLAVSDNRDGLEITLARLAHEQGVPTLGICRGMQVMNVALGGSLHRDLLANGVTDTTHRQDPPFDVPHNEVKFTEGSTLASILGSDEELRINSMHHQGVNDVSDKLTIAAISPDGVVEGLEDPAHPFFVGVQWHPEYLDEQAALFGAFIEAIKKTQG